MPLLKVARALLLPLFCLTAFTRAQAEPNLMGQTGFINMPDGRIAPDGTWRIGVSNSSPYLSGWTSVSVLPRLEFSARYTRIANTPSFGPGSGYGASKDKSFDLKFNVLQESAYWPSISIATQDFIGTKIFHADYVALSKRFGALDVSMGSGRGRIGGGFGGLRYSPAFLKNVSLVAEYDANNYQGDPSATLSGAAQLKKGPSYGIEYQWGWLGSQLSYDSGGRVGVIAYIAIPLNRKEYIPKLDEPAPYRAPVSHPDTERWMQDPAYKRRLVEALEQQDYQNISVSLTGNTVTVTLTNARISQMSRAVGRAARTVLALAPQGTREIHITYTVDDLPVATYSFFELHKLQDYFNGKITRKELAGYVAIEYASPYDETATAHRDTDATDKDSAILRSESGIVYNDAGDSISYMREDTRSNRFKISPKAAIYFNDPSGFLHYELFLRATYDKRLAEKLYFSAAVDATLLEDVSKVSQSSNSLLPHVRSDIADYKKDSKLKLSKLLLNKFYQPDTGLYARATVGIYEQMFAGTGGQVLYVPDNGNWATDLSVDWLRQRDTFGGFGFRPYSTVTVLAALHYRLPKNITVTARVGRFLAKDIGARLEFKRRFQSGIEMGGWYTITNGNDITTPGAPGKPYHDKGIFLTIPFDAMLTKDTQSTGEFSLAPWTRDVGQMVATPGDLYQLVEKPLLLDYHEQDGLVNLGDRADDYPQPRPEPTARDSPIIDTVKHNTHESVRLLSNETTWRALGLGLGVTALSSVLDRPADRLAQLHGKGRLGHDIARVGNALPLAGLAASGLLALGSNDARLSNTAYAALQAGMTAGLLSEVGGYVFGRSRPSEGQGSVNFHPLKSVPGGASFPSSHVSVAWAVVTPYAKEYDMPWLYGVAALTNVARINDRRHWLSDTVGGSLLGYACGSLLWDWNRNPGRNSPQVLIDPAGSVNLAWQFR